ncbi:DDE-type integrase/transposase/recombinase [Paenibacillus sp. LMG 31459]|uniref:DDE-type integrase/transposase/recombinase n=1 Tax=Paenibacillus phytohabitans TaxID=2654978 RepID=A0ABX1YVX5_9BACL|nr:DDE-type integrase/transposase/recombinase [Paenibacillus phytohabitans]NOU83885.1 DDE-type integrase/transposase/recombinase [Paenibacillus phytohabitans]
MQVISLIKGTRFLKEGAVFEIMKEQLPGEFIIKDLSQNNEVLMNQKDLMALYEKGTVTFEVTGSSTDLTHLGIRENRVIDFSMLSETHKNIARIRYDAIKPLLDVRRKHLQPKLEERVSELKLQGVKITPVTLRRWFNIFQDSGQDITSLVPDTLNRGVGTRLSSTIEEIIDHCIETVYAKREKISAKDIHAKVMVEIEKKNRIRDVEDRLEIPSYNTITRRIKEKDPYEMMVKREGEKQAFDKLGAAAVLQRPKQPYDVLEIDHTKLDLFVVDDETGLPLGRPYLTQAVDKATGAIVGIYVAFHAPSYVSVMQCLLHAMSPKTYVKELYPEIQGTWDMFGVPKVLRMDNGKEFQSHSLKDACAQLGIVPDYCPPRKPWYKGSVERTFRTINQQLLHKTPGTTFSNVVDKKDYNPQKNAIVGYYAFLKLLHQWIIDQYLLQFHRGTKGAPSELWRQGIIDWGAPPLLSSIPNWNIILGKLREGATIQRIGIQYKHMSYTSEQLQDLKLRLIKKGESAVRFKYDPLDMSKIHVYDEEHKRYLEVPNTNQDYSKGLTEFSHECILKQLRQSKSNINMLALAQAKEKFLEDLAKQMKLTKGPRAAALTQLSSAQVIEKEAKKGAQKEYNLALQESKAFKALENEMNGDWEVITNEN